MDIKPKTSDLGILLTRARLIHSLNYIDVGNKLNWRPADVRKLEAKKRIVPSLIREIADDLNLIPEVLTDKNSPDCRWERFLKQRSHMNYHDGLRLHAYLSDIAGQCRDFAEKANISLPQIVNFFPMVDIPKEELRRLVDAIGFGGTRIFYRLEVPYFQIPIGRVGNPVGEKLKNARLKAGLSPLEIEFRSGLNKQRLNEIESSISLPISWPLYISNVLGVSLKNILT